MSTGRLSSVAIYFTLESEANENPPEFTLTCHSRGGPVTEVEWRRNRVRVEEDSNHMTSQIIVDPSSNTVYNNTMRVRGREGGLYVCDMSNNRHEHVEGASATGLSATLRANNEMSFAQFHISPSETYKSQCYLPSILLEWTFNISISLKYSYVSVSRWSQSQCGIHY